jgi:glycosyltransferase involved in cell wall biosynthesis
MKPLLLSILPRPPHPTRDGLAIRNYHLLRGLAGEFRVRAFALRAPHLEAGEYPEGVEGIEIPQPRRRLRQAQAIWESIVAGATYSVSLYRSRDLRGALRDAAQAQAPSWFVAHSYHVGPFALEGGERSWIDFHNVDSEIWRRVAPLAASRWAARFAGPQANRVLECERRLVASATGFSCVSERDANALSKLGSRVAPLVVPNGVDLQRYALRTEPSRSRKVFFVGDLSWAPNAQAVRWWRTEVWPLVRRNHPDAVAEILGRGASKDLRRLADSSFVLLGEGRDSRPHWREAAVAVVPLLSGGGTRLKILEAAAVGVPVVSTTVGAEGLEFDPGREILIADTPGAFASAVSELLGDPARRERIARAARLRAESLYDWSAIGRRFAEELMRRGSS